MVTLTTQFTQDPYENLRSTRKARSSHILKNFYLGCLAEWDGIHEPEVDNLPRRGEEVGGIPEFNAHFRIFYAENT